MTIVPHQRKNDDPKFVIYALKRRNDTRYRYVGQTSRGASLRFYHHLWNSTHFKNPRLPVHKWMKKYNLPGDIICEVIEECSKETLDFREQFWIACLKEQGHPLLNVLEGGSGVVGHTPTEDQRKEHSLKMTGSGNPMYGKKFSLTHRKNISDALLARKMPGNRLGVIESVTERQQKALLRSRGSHRQWHETSTVFDPYCVWCCYDLYLVSGVKINSSNAVEYRQTKTQTHKRTQTHNRHIKENFESPACILCIGEPKWQDLQDL